MVNKPLPAEVNQIAMARLSRHCSLHAASQPASWYWPTAYGPA